MNKLEQLKTMTTVVADTGDIDAIAKFNPQDATTNPTLLLRAAQAPHYRSLVEQAIHTSGLVSGVSQAKFNHCVDLLAISIACEILKIIPGRISIEVDARLSFDTQEMIARALDLIEQFNARGITSDRVLIKLASTWEGIQAARYLEREGVQCNLTLLFGFPQAAACADAGVHLISPFVGRILDWHKQKSGRDSYPAAEDPGVRSVTRIYDYYKQHNYGTVVMGASFRNLGEIEQLAGCDKLTISPALLAQLEADDGILERRLSPNVSQVTMAKLIESEAEFRWSMNDDAMAMEKLAEGIRNFSVDQMQLEMLLAKMAKNLVAA